jgi:hypothetical protein
MLDESKDIAMREEYTFNAKKVIRYLGGQKKISELFTKHFKGLYDPLPENTIQSWKYAGSIPSYRLVQLVHLGAIIGSPVDTHDFLEVKKVK